MKVRALKKMSVTLYNGFSLFCRINVTHCKRLHDIIFGLRLARTINIGFVIF